MMIIDMTCNCYGALTDNERTFVHVHNMHHTAVTDSDTMGNSVYAPPCTPAQGKLCLFAL